MKESLIDFIDTITISLCDEKYLITEVEKKIAYHIDSSLNKQELSMDLIIHPLNVSMLLFFATTCTLSHIKMDINSYNGKQKLKPGAKVMKDGNIGVVEEVMDDGSVKVKFKDALSDMTYIVPEDMKWKLTLCREDAQVTTWRSQVKKGVDLKNKFSELFRADDVNTAFLGKSKVLVVCEKKLVYEYFKNLKVNNFPFFSYVPSSYCASAENIKKLGKDPFIREPLLYFTSNISTASEMLKELYDVETVIIWDYKKIKGGMVYLDDMKQEVNNLFLLVNAGDYLKDQTFKNIKGFNIYEVITSNEELTYLNNIDNTGIFAHKNVALSNINRYQRSFEVVKAEEGELLILLRDIVVEKIKDSSNNEQVKNFLRYVLGILYTFKNVPIPTVLFDNKKERYPEEQKLAKKLFLYLDILPMYFYKDACLIIEDVKELAAAYLYSHPKHQKMLEVLKNLGKNDVVVAHRKAHADVLRKYFDYKSLPIKVLTLSQILKSEQKFNSILYFGCYEWNQIIPRYKGICRKEIYILFRREKDVLEAFEKQTDIALSRADNIEEHLEEVHKDESVLHELSLEYMLGKLDEINLETYHKEEKVDSEYGPEVARPIIFEDNCFAFLSKNRRCRVVDWESEQILSKKPEELEEGDEVIFIDSNRDILLELARRLRRTNPKIEELYRYSELWKKALLNYKEKTDSTAKDIKNNLKVQGVERTETVINKWLNDSDVIGPEQDAVRALAEVTNDPEFKKHLEEVIKACEKIRALHIKLGRHLARSIAGSLRRSSTNNELEQISEDLSTRATVVTVSIVLPDEVSITPSKANRLIESDAVGGLYG